MAAQVALRRQQAQEEAEARELGIRLLRTEADLDKDDDNESSEALMLVNKEKVKGSSSMGSGGGGATKRKAAAKSGNLMNFLHTSLFRKLSSIRNAKDFESGEVVASFDYYRRPQMKREVNELTFTYLQIELENFDSGIFALA